MEWNTAPIQKNYYADPKSYLGEFKEVPQIEGQITVKDLGQSVPEGSRFGSFIQTTQNAIRMGAGKIELSTGMGGGQESVGSEAYGEDARQALREISKASNAEFVSVHTPAQIGNLSGYNQQERGFSDEYRKSAMEEVRKAIDFASDVNGGAVVVHTGEYQRDISDQPWARNPDGSYKFLGFDEEPGRNTLYMVDDRTGKLITEVRKSMVVHEPDFHEKFNPKTGRNQWVDKDGNFLDEHKIEDLFKRVPKWDAEGTKFITKRLTWKDFEERAATWNYFYGREDGRQWTPEEMFLRSQMETRILQARGSSLYHGRFYDQELKNQVEYKKLYEYLKKIEDKVPVEEQWKLIEQYPKIRGMGEGPFGRTFGGKESKLPSEWIKSEMDKLNLEMKYTHEASASADAQAKETEETMDHVVPVETYAKDQSRRSFAEAGIYAMERSHNNPHSKKDVFVAPENIFPEHGYGSHPEELIELVKDARQQMVKMMTSREIESPHKQRDRTTGELLMVANPNYDPSMTEQEAQKEAKQHIKATLDTQHLGMWWKHFQAKSGESKADRKERFDKWYMNQIKRLEDEDVIGHIHVVDAMGGGHQHLPVGQGQLPVRKALEYLKKQGYGGTMISEAHGEESMHGQGRILTEAWRGVGVPIKGVGYGAGAPDRSWTDVHHGYFGVTQNPYFIFGAYSPSNEWQLWSQVPME